MRKRIEQLKNSADLLVKQETEKLEIREDFFEELATQVERAITSSDTVFLVGDFNARLVEENNCIKSLSSSNGKLTKKLIEEYKLRVCNFSSQAEGKWTRRRVNRDGSIDESAIDYALVTDETYHDLTSVAIDEEKKSIVHTGR